MTSKPEPLTKDKKIYIKDAEIWIENQNWIPQNIGLEDTYFCAEDVKKAVEWLLQELKREKERYKEILEVISGLCIAEEKIKQAFSGVLEE